MDVLVYGFARGPGRLPEIMNVSIGGTRLRFRALSESPCFTGHDAVVLPFDTFSAWMDGAPGDAALSRLHLRARLEVLRAASAGVILAFLYEDCFAHFTDDASLLNHSLGAMVLADLGLAAARLSGPEDALEALEPCFAAWLRRFGLTESHFEPLGAVNATRPICRTTEGLIAGLAAREGSGQVLFLPAEPPGRFLEFFADLGTALACYRGACSVAPAA
jgi:hypothetical protein